MVTINGFKQLGEAAKQPLATAITPPEAASPPPAGESNLALPPLSNQTLPRPSSSPVATPLILPVKPPPAATGKSRPPATLAETLGTGLGEKPNLGPAIEALQRAPNGSQKEISNNGLFALTDIVSYNLGQIRQAITDIYRYFTQ